MTEHAIEIIRVLVWVVIGGGSMFVALIVWVALRLIGELHEIKVAVIAEGKARALAEEKLREDLLALERRHDGRIVSVERRVESIDTKCHIFHNRDKD